MFNLRSPSTRFFALAAALLVILAMGMAFAPGLIGAHEGETAAIEVPAMEAGIAESLPVVQPPTGLDALALSGPVTLAGSSVAPEEAVALATGIEAGFIGANETPQDTVLESWIQGESTKLYDELIAASLGSGRNYGYSYGYGGGGRGSSGTGAGPGMEQPTDSTNPNVEPRPQPGSKTPDYSNPNVLPPDVITGGQGPGESVPEPGMWLIMALGLAGSILSRRSLAR